MEERWSSVSSLLTLSCVLYWFSTLNGEFWLRYSNNFNFNWSLFVPRFFQQTIILTYPIRITDAFNNSRDRVRYLEALAPHLEALLSTPLTPTLTALMTTVKQMDGLSRAYARSGYLGILFTKVWVYLQLLYTCSALSAQFQLYMYLMPIIFWHIL